MMLKPIELKILAAIEQHPGVTALELAQRFARCFRRSQIYGAHRNVSTIIAKLRRLHLINDVIRCKHCKRALTRGYRDQPLDVTAHGQTALYIELHRS